MSIKIYSTPTCGYCTVAKKYLKEKGLSFTEYNVAQDPAKADEMFRKSHQYGVPVLDINGTVVTGFDKARIDTLLRK